MADDQCKYLNLHQLCQVIFRYGERRTTCTYSCIETPSGTMGMTCIIIVLCAISNPKMNRPLRIGTNALLYTSSHLRINLHQSTKGTDCMHRMDLFDMKGRWRIGERSFHEPCFMRKKKPTTYLLSGEGFQNAESCGVSTDVLPNNSEHHCDPKTAVKSIPNFKEFILMRYFRASRFDSMFNGIVEMNTKSHKIRYILSTLSTVRRCVNNLVLRIEISRGSILGYVNHRGFHNCSNDLFIRRENDEQKNSFRENWNTIKNICLKYNRLTAISRTLTLCSILTCAVEMPNTYTTEIYFFPATESKYSECIELMDVMYGFNNFGITLAWPYACDRNIHVRYRFVNWLSVFCDDGRLSKLCNLEKHNCMPQYYTVEYKYKVRASTHRTKVASVCNMSNYTYPYCPSSSWIRKWIVDYLPVPLDFYKQRAEVVAKSVRGSWNLLDTNMDVETSMERKMTTKFILRLAMWDFGYNMSSWWQRTSQCVSSTCIFMTPDKYFSGAKSHSIQRDVLIYHADRHLQRFFSSTNILQFNHIFALFVLQNSSFSTYRRSDGLTHELRVEHNRKRNYTSISTHKINNITGSYDRHDIYQTRNLTSSSNDTSDFFQGILNLNRLRMYCNFIIGFFLIMIFDGNHQTDITVSEICIVEERSIFHFESTQVSRTSSITSIDGINVSHASISNNVSHIDYTVHVTFMIEVLLEMSYIVFGYFWIINLIAFSAKPLTKLRKSFRLSISKNEIRVRLNLRVLTVYYDSPVDMTSDFQEKGSDDNEENDDAVNLYDDNIPCSKCIDQNSLLTNVNQKVFLSEIRNNSCLEENYGIQEMASAKETKFNEGSDLNIENADSNASKSVTSFKSVYTVNKGNDDIDEGNRNVNEGYHDADEEQTYSKSRSSADPDQTSLKCLESNSDAEQNICYSFESNNDLLGLNIISRDVKHHKVYITSELPLCDISVETNESGSIVQNKSRCENTNVYIHDHSALVMGNDVEFYSSMCKTQSLSSAELDSKGHDSLMSSLSLCTPYSRDFDNIKICHHEYLEPDKCDIKQLTSVKENEANFTSQTIVTSISAYKEPKPRLNTIFEVYKQIAHKVRVYFSRRVPKRHRQYKRNLRRCNRTFKYLEKRDIQCNPVHTKEIDFNINQESTRSDQQATQLHSGLVYQQNVAIRQTSQSHEYDVPDDSIGTLTSIFNDFSIQSLHQEQGYHYEWIRLASFSNFSSEDVHAIRLAKNGWYSTGNGDQASCYSCHRVHQNWTRNDDLDMLHDPDCRFLSNNIPIPRDSSIERDRLETNMHEEANDLPTQITQQTSADYLPILTTNLSSQNSQTSRIVPREDETPRQTLVQTPESAASSLSTSRETQLEALMRDPMGINFERPKYPSYSILSVRISSYTDWPAAMTQTPRDMSLAGFFYAGYGDYTRCFFCGGGLRNWEAGDDPWVEHARWFSKCAFVRQNRGQQFIDLVLQRMAELEQQQTEPQVPGPVDDKPSKEDRIMNSAAVRSIKDMGYNEEIIKAAISTIKSRLPKGKHKVSAHEILEVVFELLDKDRAGPSAEMNSSRHAERATTTEYQFNNTNISGESKGRSPPQQSEVGEEEAASQRFNSLTLNDVESLQRENTSLKDQILCKICMEKNVSIAFLPCGHLACCVDCAPAMRKCPICREFVRGTVKTFLV